jgi:sialate O-acetylesterase
VGKRFIESSKYRRASSMQRWNWQRILLASTLMACGVTAQAKINLHDLFTDHAVLQRDMPIPVWGTADDGEIITVKLGDETVTTTAEKGKWLVKFKPRQVGEPLSLKAEGKDNTVELKDILIGEVWLCGGQSNMQWSVDQCETPAQIKTGANHPNLRLISIERVGSPTPQYNLPGKKKKEKVKDESGKEVTKDIVGDPAPWVICSDKTVGPFSAVGYHYGVALQKKLGVPVGLINSNYGGTPAQRWAAAEDLWAVPETKPYVKTEGQGGSANLKTDGSDLYNAMIAPLAPYVIRGAIWYQGESNAGQAERYRTLFPTMIQSWRKTFGQPELPFYFVQLAPYKDKTDKPQESDWAELREAQLMTLSKLPNTGMVVITDVGNEKNIHPIPKQPVGERLALAALANTYKEKIEYSGPVFESLKIHGDKATLRFSHIGEGLEAKGDKLTGFTMAGEDKVWHNADAKIEGETVVVTCDQVSKPVAVRFGWANFPIVNLWNKDGLPATPFRTDNWPGVTAGK